MWCGFTNYSTESHDVSKPVLLLLLLFAVAGVCDVSTYVTVPAANSVSVYVVVPVVEESAMTGVTRFKVTLVRTNVIII